LKFNTKRFYKVSNILLGKGDKFLEVVKVVEKTIYNYVYPNVQKNLSYKQEKILKHYGPHIKGNFYDKKNKVYKAFGIITTKEQKKIEKFDSKNKIQTINLSNKNKLSKNLLLIEDKKVNKLELNNSLNNTTIDKQSLENLNKVFDNDSIILKKNSKIAELETLKVLEENKIVNTT
jgi:hypothetical protein